MATSQEIKQRDRKSFIVVLILMVVTIILAIITSGFWKVLFIIAAVICGILTLIFLFAYLHLKDVKTPKKVHGGYSGPLPKEDAYDKMLRERSQLDKEAQKGWDIYLKAQEGGYANYQKYKRPLAWKEGIWDKLNSYEKKGYVDVVKTQMKYADRKKWEEDHAVLVKAGKAIKYIGTGDFIYDIANKIGNPYSDVGGLIQKKSSPEVAAKDIRKILRSSGSYQDGTNGACKYAVRDIYVKYNEINIDVEVTSHSLGQYGSLTNLRGNLRNDIYTAVYPESGGYSLRITVY